MAADTFVKQLVRSALVWMVGGTIVLFLFIIFVAPALLRGLGWLFKAMGGQSLEDMGL